MDEARFMPNRSDFNSLRFDKTSVGHRTFSHEHRFPGHPSYARYRGHPNPQRPDQKAAKGHARSSSPRRSAAPIPSWSSIPPAFPGPGLGCRRPGQGSRATATGASNGTGQAGGPLNEDDIWAQLKTCYDPEIPVNIVDLGLIYSLEIKPQEGGGNLVEVKMTLTAPGCGMGPSIASDAQRKILTVPGVTDAQVDVVWDPPWSAERISPEGKQKLGMI